MAHSLSPSHVSHAVSVDTVLDQLSFPAKAINSRAAASVASWLMEVCMCRCMCPSQHVLMLLKVSDAVLYRFFLWLLAQVCSGRAGVSRFIQYIKHPLRTYTFRHGYSVHASIHYLDGLEIHTDQPSTYILTYIDAYVRECILAKLNQLSH